MSLLRPGVIKQHKPNPTIALSDADRNMVGPSHVWIILSGWLCSWKAVQPDKGLQLHNYSGKATVTLYQAKSAT